MFLDGSINYSGNTQPAVSDVALDLIGSSSTLDTTSNLEGAFFFTGVNAGPWTLAPTKLGDLNSGRSAFDAALMLQSRVGIITLDNDQQLSCDASGNGSVSAFDAALILQYLVGIIPTLPATTSCGSDWLFIPDSTAVPGQSNIPPSMSPSGCGVGSVIYSPLNTSLSNQNFRALLLGDCSGNWEPSGGGASSDQETINGANFRVGRVRVRGRRVIVAVYAEPGAILHALDLELAFNPESLVVRRARAVGAAKGMLLQSNEISPGRLRIASAGAETVRGDGGPILILRFSRRSTSSPLGVQTIRFQVDDRSIAF